MLQVNEGNSNYYYKCVCSSLSSQVGYKGAMQIHTVYVY